MLNEKYSLKKIKMHKNRKKLIKITFKVRIDLNNSEMKKVGYKNNLIGVANETYFYTSVIK